MLAIDGGTHLVGRSGPFPFETVLVVYASQEAESLRDALALGLEPTRNSSCCLRDDSHVYWVFTRPATEVYSRKIGHDLWIICSGDLAIEPGARWISAADNGPCPPLIKKLASLQYATIEDALNPKAQPSLTWVGQRLLETIRHAYQDAASSSVEPELEDDEPTGDGLSIADQERLLQSPERQSPGGKLEECVEASRDHFDYGDSPELARRFFADHGVIVRKKANNLGAGRFVADNGDLYEYDSTTGCWREIHDDLILLHLMDYSGCSKGNRRDPKILTLDHNKLTQAVKSVKVIVSKRGFFKKPQIGVCCRNGFVGLDGARVVLKPHDQDHRQLSALNVNYDPDARAPNFERYLDEVFQIDGTEEDGAAQRRIVQECVAEFVGACLFGIATRFQKTLFLTGTGSNGKSVLLTVVRALFPDETVLSLPPNQWEGQFSLAALFGKRVNIVNELPKKDLFDTDRFKAVISGDEVTTDRKNKDMLSFRPTAGHLFAANQLPVVSDTSHGFWRRVLIAPMTRKFELEAQDPMLPDRIIQHELAGVAAWAIRGAQRLLDRNGYEAPRASIVAVEDWREQSDAIRLFLADCCDIGVTDDDGKAFLEDASKVYEAYKLWCAKNVHRPCASNTFGRRMNDADVQIVKAHACRKYRLKLRSTKTVNYHDDSD